MVTPQELTEICTAALDAGDPEPIKAILKRTKPSRVEVADLSRASYLIILADSHLGNGK